MAAVAADVADMPVVGVAEQPAARTDHTAVEQPGGVAVVAAAAALVLVAEAAGHTAVVVVPSVC